MEFNLEKIKEEMRFALQNEISKVWYCDHIMDNSFVNITIDETIRKIPKEYIPIGFCYVPEYRPESGVGFCLQRREDGIELWCHVPWVMFEKWLLEFNLLDEMFPKGTSYLWYNKNDLL